jgi:hypothetical protein
MDTPSVCDQYYLVRMPSLYKAAHHHQPAYFTNYIPSEPTFEPTLQSKQLRYEVNQILVSHLETAQVGLTPLRPFV